MQKEWLFYSLAIGTSVKKMFLRFLLQFFISKDGDT